MTDAGNPDGSRHISVLTPTGLALLLEALTDRKAQRRLIGRLRPRLFGRPHPIVRLPRRRRPGLLSLAPGMDRQPPTGESVHSRFQTWNLTAMAC